MRILVLSLLFSQSALAIDYSDARNKAFDAAYIQTGGKAFQDKLGSYYENKAKSIVYKLGVPKELLIAIYGGYKIYKARSISFPLHGKKISIGYNNGAGNIGLSIPINIR